MPSLSFSEDEIVADGDNNVNSRGMVYVGTKHVGKKVRWLIIEGDQPQRWYDQYDGRILIVVSVWMNARWYF